VLLKFCGVRDLKNETVSLFAERAVVIGDFSPVCEFMSCELKSLLSRNFFILGRFWGFFGLDCVVDEGVAGKNLP
jgi:hypothetical protein